MEQALKKELRELKAEVAAVKERVRTPPQAQNLHTQQPMRQTPQCRTCQQSNIIQQSFPSVHHTQVGALVNLIQSRSQDSGTSAVKVGKRVVMLPKGEATKVKCQVYFRPVPEGMPMIF